MSLYLHNGIIWHMISESWLSEGVGQNKVYEIKKKLLQCVYSREIARGLAYI